MEGLESERAPESKRAQTERVCECVRARRRVEEQKREGEEEGCEGEGAEERTGVQAKRGVSNEEDK
eukprot:3936939-Pleurochrysis_carterae.AAC.2